MNGLVVVAIVFISLAIVPVGVLSGVIFSEGGYNMHEFTVGPNDNQTVHMQVMGDLMFYYDVASYPISSEDIEIYLLTDAQYISWSGDNTTPTEYVLSTTGDLPFRWIEAKGEDHYLIVYNYDGVETLDVELHYVTADRAKVIALLSVGIFFSLWVTILTLYTIAYILKVLIFIPIFGLRYTNGDSRRKERSYSYDYRVSRAPAAPATPAAPAAPAAKGIPAVKAAPAARPILPKAPQAPIPVGPAAQNISANYIIAGTARDYPKDDFKRFWMKTWDGSGIAEKVLVVIALFFLLTGAVTTTWYILAVFPLTLLGIATIVFFTNRNRREKLVRLVESHGAIYISDAARILRTSTEFIRMDAWKIVNLGLGPIAFDTQNHILFDVTKVDPSKAGKMSPEAKKVHDELVSEVAEKETKDKTEEKKVVEVVSGEEVKCPFCDSNNPPDSSFCIKCGASLKPAK